MKKHPNTNIQAPMKLQTLNAKVPLAPRCWLLVLGASLEFGAWNLEL
jgi:hypothetical protein